MPITYFHAMVKSMLPWCGALWFSPLLVNLCVLRLVVVFGWLRAVLVFMVV